MPRQQIRYEYQSSTTSNATESTGTTLTEDSLVRAWRTLIANERLAIAPPQSLSYSVASNEDVKREAKANGFSKWIQKIESS